MRGSVFFYHMKNLINGNNKVLKLLENCIPEEYIWHILIQTFGPFGAAEGEELINTWHMQIIEDWVNISFVSQLPHIF